MQICSTVAEVRAASRKAKSEGYRVALVPTMGYLHRGHLELVRKARELAGWVAVSIFVNPTQFGPREDLDRYPRDLAGDTTACESELVDALFVPSSSEVYPQGYQTYVEVERLSVPLCGRSRPTHFRGVSTVVAKLFHMVEPDVAVFGEKDYQQLQVVRHMVRDLNMDVDVVGVPTVREPDGLALSSRNAYLSAEERIRARSLSQALAAAQTLVDGGAARSEAILKEVRRILEAAGAEVDYAELRHPETLEAVERVDGPSLLALAAKVGRTRLIDNRILGAPPGAV